MNWRICRKIGTAVLTALLGLCLLLLLVLTSVLYSEKLDGWLLDRALSYVNAETGLDIHYAEFSGRLLHGIELSGLQISIANEDAGEADTIDVQRFAMRWRLGDLLQKRVYVSSIAVEKVGMNFHPVVESEPTEPADPQAILDSLFQLPLDIVIDDIDISQVAYAAGDTQINLQRAAGKLHWSRERIALDDISVELQPLQLNVPQLQLHQDMQLQADMGWQAVLAERELAGELTLAGDIQRLEITHSLHLPLPLETQGTLESGLATGSEPVFDFLHRIPFTTADNIHVPEAADQLESLLAEFHTHGSVSEVMLEAEISAELIDHGVVDAELAALYAENSVDIRQLTLNSGYGNFSATAEVLLDPLSTTLDWQLNAEQVEGLPEMLTLSGLSGEGRVALQQQDQGMALQLDLSRLSAVLNDYPLHAEAHARLLDTQLLDARFDLQSGDNTFQVSGMMDDAMAFDWYIDAPALAELWPGLYGTLQGEGQLAGTLDSPQMLGNLTGRQLTFVSEAMEAGIERLDFTADADFNDGQISLALEGMNFAQGEQEWQADSLLFEVSGSPAAHELGFNFSAPALDLEIVLGFSGAVVDSSWQGRLERASFDTGYGDWRLQAPAAIMASAEQATLDNVCWQMLPISVCAEGSWQKAGAANAGLTLAGIPLSYLSRTSVLDEASLPQLVTILEARPDDIFQQQMRYDLFLPEHFFARGELGATLTVSTPDGGFEQLQAAVALTAEDVAIGLISEVEEDMGEEENLPATINEFNIIAREISATRQPGLWSGHVDLALQQADSTDDVLASVRLLPGMDDEKRLQGDVLLDIPDFQWLESLVPDITDVRGRLHMNGELAGDLTRPLLQMNLALNDAGLQVPVAGIEVNAIDLAVRSDDDNNFFYEGSASSAEGSLSISGEVLHPLLEERRVSLDISGNDFRVVELPGTVLEISPSLQLAFQDDTVNINGDVLIPYLDVQVEEALENAGSGISAVAVSNDVILVDEPQSRLRVDTTGNSGIPVRMRVGVGLGDYVHLSAYGLDVNLEGEVLVEQEPRSPLLVYGEVNVAEGAYEIYGQRLETERGQLLFLGNPSNPALDVRASREVEETTVGIQLNGTLNNMQGQLFSIPNLPEAEALAMLITGRSFGSAGESDTNRMLAAIVNLGLDRGQGITDSVRSGLGVDTLELSGGENLEDSYLGIGKYITPSLFMRYDIGLFDRESVLTMIYALTQRINLEVESGISQSIDLTYKLEK